jgi:hypothetical protein
MPPNAQPIRHRWFTDGVNRPVSLDADGQQFILDGDGEPLADFRSLQTRPNPTSAYRCQRFVVGRSHPRRDHKASSPQEI